LYVRKASTDQLFVFCLTLAMYGFLRDVERPDRGWTRFLLLYVGAALGVLAKGFLGLMFPMLIGGIGLAWVRPLSLGELNPPRGALATGDRRVGARNRGSLRALAVQARVLRAARLPRARPPGGRRLGERARHRALARHRHAWLRRRRRLGPLAGCRAHAGPGDERARGAERVLPDPSRSGRPLSLP